MIMSRKVQSQQVKYTIVGGTPIVMNLDIVKGVGRFSEARCNRNASKEILFLSIIILLNFKDAKSLPYKSRNCYG